MQSSIGLCIYVLSAARRALRSATTTCFAQLNCRHLYDDVTRARAGHDARGAIGASKDAKIDFSGAASNITLTSHSNWKEFDISKVASVDGLSFDIKTSRNSK